MYRPPDRFHGTLLLLSLLPLLASCHAGYVGIAVCSDDIERDSSDCFQDCNAQYPVTSEECEGRNSACVVMCELVLPNAQGDPGTCTLETDMWPLGTEEARESLDACQVQCWGSVGAQGSCGDASSDCFGDCITGAVSRWSSSI